MKMSKNFILFIASFAIIAAAAGCGIYSFSAGGKSSIKTIAITQFENKTVESGLSSRMTDLVVDAFIADGTLKVVSPDKADAVLSGTLTSYDRKAKEYTEADNVSQYAVTVVFDVVLNDPKAEKEIWKERFISEGIYDSRSETEDEGQVRAADKLVVDIINRTTKSW
jgi:hypothetical protein